MIRKLMSKWSQHCPENHPKSIPKSFQNGPKTNPRRSPKWSQHIVLLPQRAYGGWRQGSAGNILTLWHQKSCRKTCAGKAMHLLECAMGRFAHHDYITCSTATEFIINFIFFKKPWVPKWFQMIPKNDSKMIPKMIPTWSQNDSDMISRSIPKWC